MEKEGVVERVRDDIAPYLAERFTSLLSHPLVGEARTHGMMAGLVLMKNKATREMFPSELSVGMACRAHCFGNGLIMRAVGDRMIIAPPLVMTRHDIDTMMTLIVRCLDLTWNEAQHKGWC
jgi:putrescine aminotransferase